MKPAVPRPDLVYTFRPALFRRAQQWTLSSDHITGPGGTIALNLVSDAALIQMRSSGGRVIRFDLASGGKTTRMQITTSARRRTPDADQQQYLAMISETAARLAQLVPGLTYRMEESGRARLTRFMIGSALLMIGLALTGYAFLTLYDRILLLLAALPFLATTKIIGGALIYRFWPLRQPEAFPIATLPFILWTMGGPRPEGIPMDQSTPMS